MVHSYGYNQRMNVKITAYRIIPFSFSKITNDYIQASIRGRPDSAGVIFLNRQDKPWKISGSSPSSKAALVPVL